MKKLIKASADSSDNSAVIQRVTNDVCTLLENYIDVLQSAVDRLQQTSAEINSGKFGSTWISDKDDDEYFDPKDFTSDEYLEILANYTKLGAIREAIHGYINPVCDAIEDLRDSQEFATWR